MISLPRSTAVENTWFSRYPVASLASSASRTMARASARLRASGFSQAMPRSRLPPFTALWIACMVATRVSLGERIQSASTSLARISLSSDE